MLTGWARPGGATRALVVLLAILLLLTVPAATGWTQMRGGPDRPSMLPLDPGPLDVLATVDLLEDGERLGGIASGVGGPGLVRTHDGLAGIAYDVESGACVLLHLPLNALEDPPQRTDLDQCRRGSVQAYAANADDLLVCSEGIASDPVFQARDPRTGALRWSVGPADVQPALADVYANLDSAADTSEAPWTCGGTALDPVDQMAVVAFAQGDPSTQSTGAIDHAVAGIGLVGGGMVWAHRISTATFGAGQSGSNLDVDPLRASDPAGSFHPTGIALTTTGWVVTGILAFGRAPNEVAAAWGTDDAVLGGISSQTSTYWTDKRDAGRNAADPIRALGAGGSYTAVAQGPLAAFVMGDWIVVVTPDTAEPLRSGPIAQVSTASAGLWGTGPVWTRDTLIAPMREAVTAVDGFDLTPRWPWARSPGHIVTDIGTSAAGYLYVVAGERYRGADDPSNNWPLRQDASGGVAILEITDGRVVQEVPTPAAGPMQDPGRGGNFLPPALLPLGENVFGLLAADGQMTILGSAPPDERPGVSPDSAYPPLGRPVTVGIDPRTDAVVQEVRVAWGDGSTDTYVRDDPIVHTYTEEGEHTLLATLVLRDGSTRTGEATVDVGGSPQTFVQAAFAPENQDMTFGLLGIAVALAGGGFGLARVRRKRSRLQGELAALERAYEATSDDPPACEATLAERRARARGLLLDGKLDEAQFAIVEGRIGDLQQGLRTSALDERFEFLPHGMVVALRDMLSDGKISAWEREHVLRVLKEDDILTPDQKEKVRTLVDRWFRHDTGAAP